MSEKISKTLILQHKDRLIQFIRYSRLSIREFSQEAKIEYNKFNKYLNGSTKNSGLDVATAIAKAFPDLYLRWWLYGEGKMIKGNEIPKDAIILSKKEHNKFLSEKIQYYKDSKAKVQEVAVLRLEIINLMKEINRLKG